ncbi:hypothetical protein D3C78_1506310 [compost metagenome]
MNATAPTDAPPVIPITSGAASGLRITPCKIAPDIASEAPTNTATINLGARSVCTINKCSCSPTPAKAMIASLNGIIRSPNMILKQAINNSAAVSNTIALIVG